MHSRELSLNDREDEVQTYHIRSLSCTGCGSISYHQGSVWEHDSEPLRHLRRAWNCSPNIPLLSIVYCFHTSHIFIAVLLNLLLLASNHWSLLYYFVIVYWMFLKIQVQSNISFSESFENPLSFILIKVKQKPLVLWGFIWTFLKWSSIRLLVLNFKTVMRIVKISFPCCPLSAAVLVHQKDLSLSKYISRFWTKLKRPNFAALSFYVRGTQCLCLTKGCRCQVVIWEKPT